MKKFNSKYLSILSERGFIQDCTDFAGLDKYLAECETNKKPGVAYIGFDCTAPSLHAGSLMQIMALRWFQTCGHKPIALVGGGTTKIGDPSGKDETRKLLSVNDIEKNKEGIKKVFNKYIKNAKEGRDYVLVDNDEWLKHLKYMEFLRDFGRHFSVNKMINFDSVKLRLEREQHMSFLEFNYMIIQAYDFVVLNNKYHCRLQIGGSDQWGNIVNGTELSRKVEGDELFGLTTPLLTTASGAKMGKSSDGAIWLDGDMLKPYDYWQYWRNTADADVGRFLRLFTELPLDAIEKLEQRQGAEINEAKIILANEVTKMLHGEQAAIDAQATAKKVFEQGGIGDELPILQLDSQKLKNGIAIAQLFTESGLTTSNGEAKKLIQGGGAKINDEKISEIGLVVNASHLKDNVIKLSAGKKKHALVKVK